MNTINRNNEIVKDMLGFKPDGQTNMLTVEDSNRESELKRERYSVLAEYKLEISGLIEKAKQKLEKEGIDQPHKKKDYRVVAEVLESLNPRLARGYFSQYMEVLPVDSDQYKAMTAKIASIDTVLEKQKSSK